MPFVQTNWWCVEIPDEWIAEHEEDVVTISDCDDVGDIDITAVKKEQDDINDDDLLAFAKAQIEKTTTPQLFETDAAKGFYFEYEDDGTAWREWYLAAGSLLIYITYNTDIENAGMDDVVVDQIIDTLLVLDVEEDQA